MRYLMLMVILTAAMMGCGRKEQIPLPVLATNAPHDILVDLNGEKEVQLIRAKLEPYVQQARKTYPAARQRYLAGLPKGYHFFAVTRLRAHARMEEQVFVAVSKIENDQIQGRIASDIFKVTGYQRGDACTFGEAELVDWVITCPDGSEEGNIVGKFLDEMQRSKDTK